jgi:hypothetical protein
VYNSSSSPSMNSVTATATGAQRNYGVYNNASSSTIRSSSITGTTNSILSFGETSSSRVADTILDGPITGPGFACSSVSTLAGVALGPDCLTDRVITVAPQGGHYLKLSTALEAIGTDPKYPAATATDPYLIKIAPGTYTETSTVALKDFVDIEGSGQGVTTINCQCGSDTFESPSAVVSVNGSIAEIRHLTINNTGTTDTGTTATYGLWSAGGDSGSFSMLHITVTATGGTDNYGVRTLSSSPSMNNVTATATGGTYKRGVYNQSSSPSMNNVTATATGGTESVGVYNFASSPTMTNVTATASGVSKNRGVYNKSASAPTMNNVTATANGTADSNDIGLINSGGSSSTIRNSAITGKASISNEDTATAMVADTVLSGDRFGSGFTCAGVYTELFAELSTLCT